TITLGYALGRLRIGTFSFGAVTGVLLARVLVGQLVITTPPAVKQIFFLLFLFSVGYRTDRSSFAAAQAALASMFAIVGLILTMGSRAWSATTPAPQWGFWLAP